MIYRILAVSCLAFLAAAQNRPIPCGFTCSRSAAFTLFIDGVNSRVSCSDSNGDISSRCNSCCQSYAMWGGLPTSNAAGFPSSDRRDCICCVTNNRCNSGPVPAFANNPR